MIVEFIQQTRGTIKTFRFVSNVTEPSLEKT